ncbi:hypothetical protein J31TS4_44410 [Paenibacillus sp. J31TS4]|uniref:dehydrogenase n=1 Tax=Paenibacillus sp. J31TS4 TaxID=2807195 RepID=UPI001B27F507|nr:dehydrogenase [Paenibacillus sp. J31TS4]GIP41161.1 hypothetical protein J31TS4_44410 [Paenibacillus sp. J31TS4]
MFDKNKEKHAQELPTLRSVRRACSRELYRTAKRLKVWIPPDKMEEAEKLYLKKVAGHLVWIAENNSNRKLLSDWWRDNVADDIAALWNVEKEPLVKAFREAFGG